MKNIVERWKYFFACFNAANIPTQVENKKVVLELEGCAF
jgi:hypothetical protein